MVRLLTLVGLSLFCWGLWYAEVAWHGWEGLTWISYFHWAVPTSVMFFIVWLRWTIGEPAKPLLFWPGLLLYLFIGLPVYEFTASVSFNAGPGAFLNLIVHGFEQSHFRWYFMGLHSLIPIVLFVFLRSIGCARLNWTLLSISWIGFGASFVLGLLLAPFIHHGYDDLVHVFKVGSAIPFIVFFLGLPYAFQQSADQRNDAVDAVSSPT